MFLHRKNIFVLEIIVIIRYEMQIITRTDLGFIVENYEDRVFEPKNHIRVNVNKFLDLDDYSMLNCVGEIFTQEWIKKQLTGIK